MGSSYTLLHVHLGASMGWTERAMLSGIGSMQWTAQIWYSKVFLMDLETCRLLTLAGNRMVGDGKPRANKSHLLPGPVHQAPRHGYTVQMGLLALGTPLTWEEASKYADHVREHGITQLLNIWNRYKSRSGDKLYWGDEVRVSRIIIFNACSLQ
jgi:hypothetical protein